MGLAVVFTLAAFAVMLGGRKLTPFDPEALKRNPHAAVGMVSIVGVVVQPIMAYFRPHPGTENRRGSHQTFPLLDSR